MIKTKLLYNTFGKDVHYIPYNRCNNIKAPDCFAGHEFRGWLCVLFVLLLLVNKYCHLLCNTISFSVINIIVYCTICEQLSGYHGKVLASFDCPKLWLICRIQYTNTFQNVHRVQYNLHNTSFQEHQSAEWSPVNIKLMNQILFLRGWQCVSRANDLIT